MAGEYLGKGEIISEDGREVLCGVSASGASVWVQDVGYDPPVGEIS